MNVVREISNITAEEVKAGIFGGLTNGSWHDKYKNSAWVYVGGLSFELTEGDVICVMSQWGEVEDINLVRDKKTGKSMGFAFVKYEDQKSTILAVDNFNGIKLLGRTLRCDHVDKYRLPKEVREREEERLENDLGSVVAVGPGHAYAEKPLASQFDIHQGQNLWSSRKEISKAWDKEFPLLADVHVSREEVQEPERHMKHEHRHHHHHRHRTDGTRHSEKDEKRSRERDEEKKRKKSKREKRSEEESPVEERESYRRKEDSSLKRHKHDHINR